jgi:hypothetical protein
VYLGSQRNSLNTVWVPQTSGCDNLVSAICKSRAASTQVSHTLDSKFDRLCNCFDQQDRLDQRFGDDRNVSVLCFGHQVTDTPGDFQSACAFSSESYKTRQMQEHICSVGLCEQLQENFIVAPGQQPPSCVAGSTVLPGASTLSNVEFAPDSDPNTPEPTMVEEWTIPLWCHLMAGLTGLMLLACLICFIYWK